MKTNASAGGYTSQDGGLPQPAVGSNIVDMLAEQAALRQRIKKSMVERDAGHGPEGIGLQGATLNLSAAPKFKGPPPAAPPGVLLKAAGPPPAGPPPLGLASGIFPGAPAFEKDPVSSAHSKAPAGQPKSALGAPRTKQLPVSQLQSVNLNSLSMAPSPLLGGDISQAPLPSDALPSLAGLLDSTIASPMDPVPLVLPTDVPLVSPMDLPTGPPLDLGGLGMNAPPGPPMDWELPPGPPMELPPGPPLEDPPGPPMEFPIGPAMDLQGDLPLGPASFDLPPLPMDMNGAFILPPLLPMHHPGELLPMAGPACGDSNFGSRSVKEKEVWEENKSPTGVSYYYCRRTGESRWVRPEGPANVVVNSSVAPTSDTKKKLGEVESWESIGKTGWLRVETDKGYKYFFHKKKKTTSWSCPKEIEREVAELDGVLSDPLVMTASSKEPSPSVGPAVKTAAGPDVAAAAEGDSAGNPGDVETKDPKKERAETKARNIAENKIAQENRALLNFKRLMIEKGVKAFDKYEKWLPKLVHDSRFTAVPQKDRKKTFDQLSKTIDAERRKQVQASKRSGREVFREMLEKADKLGMLHDRTVAAVQRALEAKFADDGALTALPEQERERLIADAVEQATAREKKKREVSLHEFRCLVQEILRGRDEDPPPFQKARRRLQEDKRWALVESSTEREKIYDQIAREVAAARRQRLRRQRQDANEIDSIRKKQRLSTAEESFRNLLAERVKAPFAVSWEDVRTTLGDHPQFKNCELKETEQERVFEAYQQALTADRRRDFMLLLEHAPADAVGPEKGFDEVFEAIVDVTAAKALAGMPEAVLKSALEEWRGQSLEQVIEVCWQWLRSCTHFIGFEAIDPDEDVAPFQDLLGKLSSDVRFQRVGTRAPDEQRRLVVQRLKELREAKAKAQARGSFDEDAD